MKLKEFGLWGFKILVCRSAIGLPTIFIGKVLSLVMNHLADVYRLKCCIQSDTSCVVNLFNPNELWSIAIHYGGQ